LKIELSIQMSKKETKHQAIAHTSESLFGKENYMWMIIGVVVIAIGMLVMSGGKSSNPAVFDQKEVYSTTRITIAPILILIGLAIEVFAIFKKPKA
jgi:heme/copper-type cytochrome/quinol oxidase subunit 2